MIITFQLKYCVFASCMKKDKENLILVNPFYANSILLKGLIEYLNDYFTLHFFDLPGFSKNSMPLEKITWGNLSDSIQKKIERLNLDHYIVGGISFGFNVVNNIPLEMDDRCKGILAIFPYIDSKSLNFRKRKKIIYSTVVNLLCFTGLSSRIWKNKYTEKFAYWYSTYPPERVKVILEQMDGKTFFQTARLILHNNHGIKFHEKPYILIINKDDNTIKYDYCLQTFRENVDDLFVLHSEIDHYPEDLSKKYIQERFSPEDIPKAIDFLNGRRIADQ